MRHRFAISLTVFAILAAASAQAGIIFSNVTIQGSLSGGASYVTGPNTIDFAFPNASVGDSLPLRSGTLLVTFEVATDDNTLLTQDVLDINGAVGGSGTIFINEVVEDLTGPQIVATLSDAINKPDDLPYNSVLDFSSGSTHIKVKKSFFLTAPPTDQVDIASLGQMKQTIVPEPASVALLSLGALLLCARRRS